MLYFFIQSLRNILSSTSVLAKLTVQIATVSKQTKILLTFKFSSKYPNLKLHMVCKSSNMFDKLIEMFWDLTQNREFSTFIKV